MQTNGYQATTFAPSGPPGVQFSVLQQLPDANLAVTVTDLLLDEDVVIE